MRHASPPLSESLQGMLDNSKPVADWNGVNRLSTGNSVITTNNVMYTDTAGTTTVYNASESLAD